MKKGKVYLVGAGPGEVDYLTVKAYRLVKAGDIILYDTLTSESIRDLAFNAEEILDVGKRPKGGGKTIRSQESINRLMAQKARLGKTVIRLKGGDPNVFGRGGEEAVYLAEAGIPFEIVPGVSSMLAAPGIANIPLTHRKLASSFTVITGHEDPTKENSALNWEALAQNINAGGTLVILMGVRRLAANVEQLLENNVPGDIPVAVIEKATYPDEEIVSGTLNNICELTWKHDIAPPALFVIGEVVSIREQIENAIESAKIHAPVHLSTDSFQQRSDNPESLWKIHGH